MSVFNSILKQNRKCLIIPHQSPDGDCLGSSFALSAFFKEHNCDHFIIMDDVIPTNYQFLKTEKMVTSAFVLEQGLNFDYAIILDTSSIDRAGCSPEVLDLCHETLVIDHHTTNNHYGDTNIVEMVSSVGELLYNLFVEYGYKPSKEVATGLYTSIVTDTGEFRYSNTSDKTLEIAGALLRTGFDIEKVLTTIFSNQPLKKVLLKSASLANLKIYGNGAIALVKVSQELIQSLDCEMFHADGIVEAGRDIEGIEVSILLKEISEQEIKVSMRSKSYVDVSEVSLIYKGGGHKRAAGCTFIGTLIEAEQAIIKILEEKI